MARPRTRALERLPYSSGPQALKQISESVKMHMSVCKYNVRRRETPLTLPFIQNPPSPFNEGGLEGFSYRPERELLSGGGFLTRLWTPVIAYRPRIPRNSSL